MRARRHYEKPGDKKRLKQARARTRAARDRREARSKY